MHHLQYNQALFAARKSQQEGEAAAGVASSPASPVPLASSDSLKRHRKSRSEEGESTTISNTVSSKRVSPKKPPTKKQRVSAVDAAQALLEATAIARESWLASHPSSSSASTAAAAAAPTRKHRFGGSTGMIAPKVEFGEEEEEEDPARAAAARKVLQHYRLSSDPQARRTQLRILIEEQMRIDAMTAWHWKRRHYLQYIVPRCYRCGFPRTGKKGWDEMRGCHTDNCEWYRWRTIDAFC